MHGFPPSRHRLPRFRSFYASRQLRHLLHVRVIDRCSIHFPVITVDQIYILIQSEPVSVAGRIGSMGDKCKLNIISKRMKS